MTISKEASAELARLAERNGGAVTPADVVASARAPESPLHSAFEWEDSVAAEHWRLHQARQLIRVAVHYLPSPSSGQPLECRVFASLTPDRLKGGAGYRLVSVIMADDDMRRQLLLDARDDMKRFTARFRNLTELAEVFEAMEEAEAVLSATLDEHVGA